MTMRWHHWQGEGTPSFADRAEAGRALGAVLGHEHPEIATEPGLLVLGLPRGGVVVAAEVAASLDAPLDVLVVRKLGVPWHPELAFGAIAAGVEVRNDEVVAAAGLDERQIAEVVAAERAELARREARYRGGRPPLDLAGRTVLLVDDGLATGATARAALAAAHAAGASRVVLAVPVAAEDSVQLLREAGEEVVTVAVPHTFYAVGQFYDVFDQTSDDEVRALLA